MARRHPHAACLNGEFGDLLKEWVVLEHRPREISSLTEFDDRGRPQRDVFATSRGRILKVAEVSDAG